MNVTDGPEFGEKNSEKKNSEYYYMIYMEMYGWKTGTTCTGQWGLAPCQSRW